MTPRQAIVQNLNRFRIVPKNSLLWLDIHGAEDLIESREVRSLPLLLERYGRPETVTIHLDTPDGDFEDAFLLNAVDLLTPPERICRNSARLARNEVMETFGSRRIENVEKVAKQYAMLLLTRFRHSNAYYGPDPRIWIRWHTKISWGGSRGITISPGYLYKTSSDFFGFLFREYHHVSSSPVIGNFMSMNRLNHVKALVAHELAHFLQYHADKANLPALDYIRAHGDGWQHIYAILRQDLNRYVLK